MTTGPMEWKALLDALMERTRLVATVNEAEWVGLEAAIASEIQRLETKLAAVEADRDELVQQPYGLMRRGLILRAEEAERALDECNRARDRSIAVELIEGRVRQLEEARHATLIENSRLAEKSARLTSDNESMRAALSRAVPVDDGERRRRKDRRAPSLDLHNLGTIQEMIQRVEAAGLQDVKVARLGFPIMGDSDGPEEMLAAAIQGLVAAGRRLIAVSVLRSQYRHESYEAFVVHSANI